MTEGAAHPHSSRFPAALTLVGAGKMGGALLDGWLAAGLDPRSLTVLDPHAGASVAALGGRGAYINPEPGPSAPPATVLVLAVKPQMLDEAAPGLQAFIGPETLVVSILAGKTLADLRRACPSTHAFVRAMPNLPASIGRGATGAFASADVTEVQKEMADTLLATSGLVVWLGREDLIDAVTALSGSGPAYVFHLVECMAAAGTENGLSPDLAMRLARATVTGAADLMEQSGLEAGQLRENVTSPGGTTAAALDVLRAPGGMGRLMSQAIAAAKQRAAELAG